MRGEYIEAVREVRREADRLRIACVAAGKVRSLLHIAYDAEIIDRLTADQAALVRRLGSVQ